MYATMFRYYYLNGIYQTWAASIADYYKNPAKFLFLLIIKYANSNNGN